MNKEKVEKSFEIIDAEMEKLREEGFFDEMDKQRQAEINETMKLHMAIWKELERGKTITSVMMSVCVVYEEFEKSKQM